MLLTEMSIEELRKRLHHARQEVGDILMEIRARERKRLINLGKTIAGKS